MPAWLPNQDRHEYLPGCWSDPVHKVSTKIHQNSSFPTNAFTQHRVRTVELTAVKGEEGFSILVDFSSSLVPIEST
jgi:hypothetical protein